MNDDRFEWMDGLPPVFRCPLCRQAVPMAEVASHRHMRVTGAIISVYWVGGVLVLWGILLALVIMYGSGG